MTTSVEDNVTGKTSQIDDRTFFTRPSLDPLIQVKTFSPRTLLGKNASLSGVTLILLGAYHRMQNRERVKGGG